MHPSWLINGINQAVSVSGLFDVGMKDYHFTWESGRGSDNFIEERLDRALGNHDQLSMFLKTTIWNLEISTSDHMLIFMDPIISLFIPRNCKFRFKNAWLCESKCGEVIQKGWVRNPMGSIQDKIQTCGKVLQDQGNSVIRNFHQYFLIL